MDADREPLRMAETTQPLRNSNYSHRSGAVIRKTQVLPGINIVMDAMKLFRVYTEKTGKAFPLFLFQGLKN